jgi:hypothetical protein
MLKAKAICQGKWCIEYMKSIESIEKINTILGRRWFNTKFECNKSVVADCID